LKEAMRARFGDTELSKHFADTNDTLCYATWDNQEAVKGLIASGGEIAIVVGGYNSSNTSHLVELLEEHVPTFYIKDASEIVSVDEIRHLLWRTKEVITTRNWLPKNTPVEILMTAGASCPDALVDEVIERVSSFFQVEQRIEQALAQLEKEAVSAAMA
jgi:4-hydroxy-3-methylbut-2-en-1-yl diphosphate reductase